MQRKRILLVDDYPSFGITLRIALSGEHDLDVVHSGPEALRAMSDVAYERVLCDLVMPDVDGVTLYHQIRSRWPGREQAVIFLTAGPFRPDAVRFLEEVPNPRLSKPFQIETLLSLLDAR